MAQKQATLINRVALAAAASVLAFALPTSVLAIGLLEDGGNFSAHESPARFTPAGGDPRLAELVAERSGGKARMMRFTPAGVDAERSPRSLTVAVRVDGNAVRGLAMRKPANEVARQAENSVPGLNLAPTRYNLGIAKGYSSFAQPNTPAFASGLGSADIPDLADFRPSPGVARAPSRFAAHIELDEKPAAGRDTEARKSISDQMLDVAGSYRLTRNLDITAGVRYQQERDLAPLPDIEQQDSQAVYIGTQFKF